MSNAVADEKSPDRRQRIQVGLRLKLYGIILIVALGVVAVSAALVYSQMRSNTERRHAELQRLVQTAVSVIESQHNRAVRGEISEADAKREAIKLIAGLRYAGNNYFWINDLHPTMIMHPFRSDLNGKDLSGIKDPNGFPLFVQFAKVAKESGAGFVEYMWPKPNAAKPVEKVSYVTLFKPWGWVVGTGVYNDDLAADRDEAILIAASIGGLVFLLVAGLTSWIVRDVVFRMTKLKNMALALADNNFAVTLPDTNRHDEIADIERAMGLMIRNVSATIVLVKQSASDVNNAAAEVSTATTDLSQRTEEQAASLEETSAAMEELAATVRKNAENAQFANQDAATTREVADRGGQVVAKAVDAMARIEESSRKISDIIGVIDEIARQTNLLALNAAVEAARAGEAGRGFAVVASEVRSLAQRSSQAAKDIKDLITNSNGQVKDGVDLVNKAGQSLTEIVASINKVAAVVAEIANASAEQTTGIEEINKALTQMDEVTQQNSALVEENAATAKTLEHQAKSMDEHVAFFKIGAETNAASRPAAAAVAHPSKAAVTPIRKAGASAGPARTMQAHLATAVGQDWREF